MKTLVVHFTSGFTDGPPGLDKLGPKRKSVKEAAFQRIHRRLLQIGKICQNGEWLGLSHLQEPAHSRSIYPPQMFGAFLSDLDHRDQGDCLSFAGLAQLSDQDPEGYFTRYDARLEDLHCAVLFTLLPSPRLVVFGIGDKTHISGLLYTLRSVETAKEVIAAARALRT
ncbi:hypothetical protein ACQQ2Q_12225 [Agrobacterium sp. ES01]|uniref:hypothetical protein n=1 Tax=Agrobacterium sp. ES01 TaxID=3420714 RepID=UPI003D0DF528